MKHPLIGIVVLNWNGWQDTCECLKSLAALQYPNTAVVLVDNGSTDHSPEEMMACLRPEVAFIAAGINRGFSAGNNLGISYLMERGAEYILLLNNDTVVAPDLLDAFLKVAAAEPQAGALAAKIYYYDSPDVFWFAGAKSPTPWMAPMHIGQGEQDRGQYDQVSAISSVNGCAFFVRTAMIRQIGPLDERYFLKYEDVDWSLRIQAGGWQTLFVPGARVWHKVSRASGGVTPLWWYFDERSRLLWQKLHFPELSWSARYGRLLREIWLELYTGQWKKWRIWLARLWGVIDFWRGCTGNCPPMLIRLSWINK
ncbi:MAG TPA: glycosyltransferase family 2 protein [Patescibacteria group bacterium]|nr:glycosyltransferase family 2 protein [Patescibacteria group bacterium]